MDSRTLDFQKFKEVFNEQLHHELIVDNPYRAGNGDYDTEARQPHVSFRELIPFMQAQSLQSTINENPKLKERINYEDADRYILPNGGPQTIPSRVAELLVYAIHKVKGDKQLEEELRAYMFQLKGEWSPKNKKGLDFTLPSVPHSKEMTDGSFSWASILKSKLLTGLKKRKMSSFVMNEDTNEEILKAIIAKFEDPKGFILNDLNGIGSGFHSTLLKTP